MANIGDDVIMNCTIPRGVLTDRYSVEWFKGLNKIDTVSSCAQSSLAGFALVISGVKSSDYDSEYYCKVRVQIENNTAITRQGSNIALLSTINAGKSKCKY